MTRAAVAVILLLFAWKGSVLPLEWPQLSPLKTPAPPENVRSLAMPLKGYLPKMTPADRQYLSHFYDAMALVVGRDGARSEPILTTTEKFQTFHAGSLQLAIDKGSVGKYGNLGGAIDEVFLSFNGPEILDIDAAVRDRLVTACRTLAWAFAINGE